MNIYLKPCPYCGTSNIVEEKIFVVPHWGWWKVYADCCDITGPYRSTREEAMAAWNQRFMDKDL